RLRRAREGDRARERGAPGPRGGAGRGCDDGGGDRRELAARGAGDEGRAARGRGAIGRGGARLRVGLERRVPVVERPDGGDGRVRREAAGALPRRVMSRYAASDALLARATRVVPGGIYGHQAPTMLVPGAYPYFFTHGDGARIRDVDGNEYVDLMCSYGPIVLGHNHPRVEEAARRQAADGNCFNGPGPVWVELAERLVDLTPWAAWAVFAKNGSDVCTWATEVARAATGRRKILVANGAYHG